MQSLPNVNKVYPENAEQADVLILLTQPNTPGWFDVRGKLVAKQLIEHGISAVAVALNKTTERGLSHLLEYYAPTLVINRAMTVHSDTIAHLAADNPHINFTTICHSSVADLGRSDFWMAEISRVMTAAKIFPNIFLGHVDRDNPFARLIGDKAVYLPNLVSRPLIPHTNKRHQIPVVSLVCAKRDLKNIPTQLLALAALSKEIPVKCLISFPEEPYWLKSFCENCELDYEFRPWDDWATYTQMVANDIDVGLQVSFTESFNFISIEHMLCGKPVVGSSAIEHILTPLVCNPNHIPQIKSKLRKAITDWDELSVQCSAFATFAADTVEREFMSNIQPLLIHSESQIDMRMKVREYFQQTDTPENWTGAASQFIPEDYSRLLVGVGF